LRARSASAVSMVAVISVPFRKVIPARRGISDAA
jgi:hypothetical protein